MAFAVFYNRADLTPIAAELTRVDLSPADRQFAQSCWQGGISGWNTAPLAPADHAGGDPDCRIVVVNATHKGSTVTLLQFREWLIKIGTANPGAQYLITLADDMSRWSGAVEPWPPA